MGKKKTEIRILDAEKFLGGLPGASFGGADEADDLDDALKDAMRTKIRRVKSLELDRYLLQSEHELEKLKREGSPSSPEGSGTEKVADAALLRMSRELSKLPEAEREMVIRNYALLKSAEGGGSSTPYLPLLVGFAKSNPGASQDQMLSYAKALGDQFNRGLETAQRLAPAKDAASNPLEFLKIFKDIIADSVQRPVVEALKQFQPRPGVWEQIIMNPDIFMRFKELGFFSGSGGGASKGTIDLEIERLRGERELNMEKLRLENRKMMLEHEAGERRADTLLKALTPVSALLASPVDKKMRQLGRQTATQNPTASMPRGSPQRQQQNPVGGQVGQEAQGSFVRIQCDCGYVGDVSFQGTAPEGITCPGCGKGLVLGEVTPAEGLAEPGPEGIMGDQGGVEA